MKNTIAVNINYHGYDFNTELLSKETIDDCSHAGACDDDVEFWLTKIDFVFTGSLSEYLRSIGAWEKDELENEEANLSRFLWLVCGDLSEEQANG